MSSEAWLSLSLPAREAEVPALEAALEDLGALAVTLEAMDARPIFDHLDGSEPALWASCRVEALFSAEVDVEDVLGALSARSIPVLGATHRRVADQDWHAAFRAHFSPMSFGRLWVVPSWCEVPDAADTVLRLDPGMAFGTGTHATTALCLRWLAGPAEVSGSKVLDYGCGSGILAIAAHLLGAAEVTAVDIDPMACAVTRENAAHNDCADAIRTCLPAELDAQGTGANRFDVVVANLLLQPVLALREAFATHLGARGRLALSGIMRDQVPRVLAHYADSFIFDTPQFEDEWALLTARRRRDGD
jgi:ribosomal protein L11 methyltransferase